MPTYTSRSDLTLHDLAHALDTAARLLAVTATYLTEIDKEIER